MSDTTEGPIVQEHDLSLTTFEVLFERPEPELPTPEVSEIELLLLRCVNNLKI